MAVDALAIGAILMIIDQARKFLKGELLFFDAMRAKIGLANLFLKYLDCPEGVNRNIDLFRRCLVQAMEAESIICQPPGEFFQGEFDSFSGRRRFFYLLWTRWISLAVEIDPQNYPCDDKQVIVFFEKIFDAMETILVSYLQRAQGF
jgi:hypothetical protein